MNCFLYKIHSWGGERRVRKIMIAALLSAFLNGLFAAYQSRTKGTVFSRDAESIRYSGSA